MNKITPIGQIWQNLIKSDPVDRSRSIWLNRVRSITAKNDQSHQIWKNLNSGQPLKSVSPPLLREICCLAARRSRRTTFCLPFFLFCTSRSFFSFPISFNFSRFFLGMENPEAMTSFIFCCRPRPTHSVPRSKLFRLFQKFLELFETRSQLTKWFHARLL